MDPKLATTLEFNAMMRNRHAWVQPEPVEWHSWLPQPNPWWAGPGEIAPTYLTRHDGRALLYAGKVNSIIGPSEQGKSWLALLATLQALRDGKEVTYVDFESDGSSIGGRLRQMGATDRELAKLRYVQPDARYQTMDMASDLITVDGLNGFYGLHGVDYNSTVEVTQFNRVVFVPWATAGSCVNLIDHTPKNTQPGQGAGAIGSQAKRAVITGASLKLTMTTAFGRGRLGKATVFVDKDRCGHVRGLQCDDGSVAELIADDVNGTKVALTGSPWVAKEANNQNRQVTMDREFARALAGGPLSREGLADNLSMGSSHTRFRDNLARLIADGRITATKVGRATTHTWVGGPG